MIKKRILLADDDQDDRAFIREMLELIDSDVNVDCVQNGKQVFDYLAVCSKQNFPSLILLDYKMPMMTAGEVLEKMQRLEQYTNIPKVVWSTSEEKTHIDRCLAAGALKYFVKPVSNTGLKAIASEILELCDDYAGR
ncbi:CheY chemotaxis protein or a CheY-like REC (receiver) domain [Chitinophaga jiangningensis]|uniref:CheY chemotaxis protein or a CheY-like REC (Receiver) domain n=1 Tax=Chitinophaga jiangningensis TaxID=1419482 RepID=A0A1M7K437_9BACT|nr:response regulator [Chitinophaga jiangningensis]SHM59941.1 CheY chemotaxis protein or a CheY-like REC (receiver) domain [Chitinophaga jiangningensis]